MFFDLPEVGKYLECINCGDVQWLGSKLQREDVEVDLKKSKRWQSRGVVEQRGSV